MRIIHMHNKQYAIHHGAHRFMCCYTGAEWELMAQTEGYNTVQRFKPDNTSILPETVERWIDENYPAM